MAVRQLEKLIRDAFKKLGLSVPEQVSFEHPENREHGDYSSNVALVLAQETGQNPRELAESIASGMKASTIVSKVEVAGPGFLNFFLSREYLLKELREIQKRKEGYGTGKEKGTVLVEYSSPNIAKPFGIGHLRSTIIGQAIYNLYKFLGYKTIGDNHLGDWGTQFGKLLYQIKKEGLERKELSVKELESLYVRFHREASEEAEAGAREWFKKLEQGDREAKAIWKKAREASLKEFERVYELLEVKIDNALGESFYEPMLKDVVKEAKEKGLAKKSRGALIIEFPEEELPPAILLKSDEATNYFTRDLACAKYRLEKWNPDLIIHEVGAEQSLYFQQLFFTVELLGWASRNRFKHVAHGLYRTKEGKFSTRKGQTIHLEDVLEEAVERAKEIIEQSETARGLSKKEKEEVAKAVGIGAVKYNDLLQHPRRDIVFDWDKMLNLKGNSAPYLQYTYARCGSILSQAKPGSGKEAVPGKVSPEEETILRLLYRFPEAVREAAENFAPNIVATFAFDVAQSYNNFYNTHRVLQAENEEAKRFRLLLTAATAQVIQNSLSLLGIKTLEKM